MDWAHEHRHVRQTPLPAGVHTRLFLQHGDDTSAQSSTAGKRTVKHTWQISEKQAHWIPGAAAGICSELQEAELKTITLALTCVSKKY